MVFILGGRASEDIFFNKISTGAQDDLKKAFDIAYTLGTKFGMLPGFEFLAIDKGNQGYSYMGEPKKLYSEETHFELDQ